MYYNYTALLLGVGKDGAECPRQPRAAIAHDQLHTLGIKPTRNECGKQALPRFAVLFRGHLIVQDLPPPVGPHAHCRDDHPLFFPHLLALVPALVNPGCSGRVWTAPNPPDHRLRVLLGRVVKAFVLDGRQVAEA